MYCLQDPPQGMEEVRYHFQVVQVLGQTVTAPWLISALSPRCWPGQMTCQTQCIHLMVMQTTQMCKEKTGVVELSGKDKFVFGHIFFSFKVARGRFLL